MTHSGGSGATAELQVAYDYRVICVDDADRHGSYWIEADEHADFEAAFPRCGPHRLQRRRRAEWEDVSD